MQSAFTIRLALVLATFALCAEPASAQTPRAAPAPSPEVAARANDLFRAAMNDVKQQKWAEAEAKFLAALALNPSYDIASNLGHTQYRLGKHRDAAENLSFALRSWPITGKQDRREAAMKRLEELRTLVATVTIRVSAPGAMVLVNGKEIGRSPLTTEVFVEPGARTIEAKLAGFQDVKQTITTAKGSQQEVSLALVPVAAQQGSPASGGATIGVAQEGKTEPSTGAPGGSGGTENTSTEGGARLGIVIAGASASTLAVVSGMVFALVSNARADDARAQRAMLVVKGGPQPCLTPALATECAEVDSSFKARASFGTAAVWSFIASGVLGAGTAIYALTAPKSPVKAAPAVGPSTAGLVISGAW